MGVMGIMGFLSGVAGNFRNHYLKLAEQVGRYNRPKEYLEPQDASPARARDRFEPSGRGTTEAPAKDTVELSGQPVPADQVDTTPAEQSKTDPSQDTDQQPAAGLNPDGTYYLTRSAQLDYELNLRFDLAAVQRTVTALSEGDSEAVEVLAAAGMGMRPCR